ncbi:MAG: hypothetical protein P1P90_03560 [Patescibacteria group bacterium]|nr:hypothetical protein [Patescibacteria group bacterium]
MSHWLVATFFGVIIFVGEFGCVLEGEPFTMAEASQNETSGDVATESMDKMPDSTKVSPSLSKNKNFIQSIALVPAVKNPHPLIKEPNSIILETCEPDPDEVAVPLNVEDGKECHKVSAFAIYADSEGITYLDTNFTWSVADESIAKIIGDESAKHNSFVELESHSDIFSSVSLTQEPRTTLTVCVEPKQGWMNKSHPALCRSLPVYAVANMQGSWCFSGNNLFQPDPGVDCQTLSIEQDGRFLRVDNYGQGTIYEKQMDFYWEELEFRTVENSGSEANGLIIAGNDVEGSFSAFRLPL